MCIREHLICAGEDVVNMRNGILYLNLLNEPRAMVRYSFALLQDQAEILRSRRQVPLLNAGSPGQSVPAGAFQLVIS